MPTRRPAYPAERKRQMVEVVRARRTPIELGREVKCSAQSISKWVVRYAADERAPRDALGRAEREELKRLRRENRQLKLKRDIPAKATAWFAGKDGKTSIGSTNS